MKTEFTTGPWEYLEAGREDSDYNVGKPLTICSPGPGRNDLANVYSRDDATVSISREQAIANAHLIAAAPDMYDALEHLQTCVSCREDGWLSCEGGLQAIAAMEKARGEQP